MSRWLSVCRNVPLDNPYNVPAGHETRLLGHRNVAMTLRYAHAGDAEVAAAAERVGEAVWGMLERQ